MKRLLGHWQSLQRLIQRDIWSTSSLGDEGSRGRLHAVLRVFSITATGVQENRVVSRAAALSFSSLIGLGPLVALATMVAGLMLDDNSPDLAVNTLNRLLTFVAPQLNEYGRVTVEENGRQAPRPGSATIVEQTDGETATLVGPTIEVRPELVNFINGFVSSSRNGAVGAVGALTLILI